MSPVFTNGDENVNTFPEVKVLVSILIILPGFLLNGAEKVNAFSFAFTLVIVAYVEEAVDDNK